MDCILKLKKKLSIPKAKPVADERIKEIIKNLTEKEVQKSVVLSIMEQLKKYRNFLSKDNLENYVQTCLGSLILTKSLDLNIKKQNKVIALVGPTGVGKTTTIAKLALIAKIIHKLDVGLISIDTYRLGAIDQLKSFADVSHTDFLVAYEPNEMPALMKKFSKKDIVFIDTVGRNHKNETQLKSNLDFLSSVKVDETFLVLSSTSSTRNLLDIANKFKMFNYSAFILSKIDEAVVHGNIINLSTKTGNPIVFLTNGQTIPDDIISADKDYIANLIYTGQAKIMTGQLDRIRELEKLQSAEKNDISQKILAVASGKGGTGKTFFAANFALQYAKSHKVLLIDMDINLSNLHLLFNVYPQKTLNNFFESKEVFVEIISKYNSNLNIIFGDAGMLNQSRPSFNQFGKMFSEINNLAEKYDLIVFDLGAGVSEENLYILSKAKIKLILTNPEPTALMDAYVLIKHLKNNEKHRWNLCRG